MKVIILHSAQVETSRALITELGVDPQMNEDIIVAPNGWSVSGKGSYATLVCPSFSAYPTMVVIEDDGRMRVKSPVAGLAECEAFINAQPEAPSKLIQLSKVDFLGLFADAELVNLKAKEQADPVVGVFWEQFRASDYIRLDDPRTIKGITALEATNNLPVGRSAQILAGESPS